MESTIENGRHLAEDADLTASRFYRVNLTDVEFENVNMRRASFHDIYMSNISIRGVQMGGATFKHIGLPSGSRGMQRPMHFEEAELNDSVFIRCNLSGVAIQQCQVEGMKIDGIAVNDPLDAYHQRS